MTPAEYPALALRTAHNLSTKKDIIHASLGMISEVGEIADMLKRNLAYGKAFDHINLVEESGDVLWYVALLCRAIDQDFAELCPQVEYAYDPVDMMVADLAQYVGLVSVSARSCIEHSLTPTYLLELRRIVTTIDKICRAAGFSLETALERNVAKLAKRFPEGFTDWHALNRDLDAERKVLEGGPQGA